MSNLQNLVESLQNTDIQALVEQDEMALIDQFIKEHASKYSLSGDPAYRQLAQNLIRNRVKFQAFNWQRNGMAQQTLRKFNKFSSNPQNGTPIAIRNDDMSNKKTFSYPH